VGVAIFVGGVDVEWGVRWAKRRFAGGEMGEASAISIGDYCGCVFRDAAPDLARVGVGPAEFSV